jgi:hypothetical protein
VPLGAPQARPISDYSVLNLRLDKRGTPTMAEIDHVPLLRQGADAGMLGVRGSRRSTRRPATIVGEIVVSSEVILGYTTLGLLLSVLAQSIARRS